MSNFNSPISLNACNGLCMCGLHTKPHYILDSLYDVIGNWPSLDLCHGKTGPRSGPGPGGRAGTTGGGCPVPDPSPEYESYVNVMNSDMERLDWLDQALARGLVRIEDMTGRYNDTGPVQLFTVPSQHVRGDCLRSAIDAAMVQAKERQDPAP